MYQELADIACDRITMAITRKTLGKSPIKVILDPYNPIGSSSFVNFTTSKTDRWETDARRCQINWVILDSDWEAEFCRVAESHPHVKAYIKNHTLGFEVPYRFGSENRKYRPDFIVLVDDGHGEEDPLHLVVEIKGYRQEDAKEKKSTMETYWVPGVNNGGKYGRWAFAEFTAIYAIEADFRTKVQEQFQTMLASLDRTSVDHVSADSFVTQQLGQDDKWTRLTVAIWEHIKSTPDQTFRLADLERVSQSVSCTKDAGLTVLALLSDRFLRMELVSDSSGQVDISMSEFIDKLTAWWRTKSLSDSDWREWASRIQVTWRPISIEVSR
jgi:type III restriction enzyme